MRIFLLVLQALILAQIIQAQSPTFSATGYYDKTKERSKPAEFIGSNNLGYFYYEWFVPPIGHFKDLTIKMLDKKTLKVKKRIVLEDVDFYDKKDDFKFIDCWLDNRSLNCLVKNNKTDNVEIIKLNASTLKREEGKNDVINLSKKYNDYITFKDERYVWYRATKNELGEYYFIAVFYEGMFNTTMALCNKFNNEGKKVGQFEIGLEGALDVGFRSMNNGELVVFADYGEYQKYGQLDIMSRKIIRYNESGKLLSTNDVILKKSNADFLGNVSIVQIRKILKNGKIYFGGFDLDYKGVFSGSSALNNENVTLYFNQFTEEQLAKFWISKPSNMEKSKKRVRNKKLFQSLPLGDDMRTTGLSLGNEGNMVLNAHYLKTTIRTNPNDYRTRVTYDVKKYMVIEITHDNNFGRFVVLEPNSKSFHILNMGIRGTQSICYKGKIINLVPAYDQGVKGFEMEDRTSKGGGFAIVVINENGTYYKERFQFKGDLNGCLPLIDEMIKDDDSFVFPVYHRSVMKNGFVRFKIE